MNRKKLKKAIIILLIVVFILVMYTILYSYFISEKYVLKLLKGGINKVNYSETGSYGTTYVIGNIEKTVSNNGSITYNNYETKESIVILENEKKITIHNNNGIESSPHFLLFYEYFESEEYEFLYEGIEKINGNKCIKFCMFRKEKSLDGSNVKEEFWVNKKLGSIEKKKSLYIKDGKENVLYEKEYNMTEGDVTEEDVSRPDLDLYKDYEIITKSSEN